MKSGGYYITWRSRDKLKAESDKWEIELCAHSRLGLKKSGTNRNFYRNLISKFLKAIHVHCVSNSDKKMAPAFKKKAGVL